MNWYNIEQILERYWEGNTTIDEEALLKKAFSQDKVPEHLLIYSAVFQVLKDKSSEKFPTTNFENSFNAAIETKKTNFRISHFLTYAAAVLILLTSTFFILKKPAPKYQALTANEMAVAQKYLGLMATNMEKSAAISTRNLNKFKLLNKGSDVLKVYENSYNKSMKNLQQVEQIDYSYKQLKHLKSIENNKIKS
ncbi:MAG: hypothetical protein JW729_03925 [Bacteroidales bacterium]|nr:hypothetical protein [Bacteroidales bacterium]